jgi:hypothetical protein
MKLCIAGALVVSALTAASSASATTWTTNAASGPNFAATGGPSLLTVKRGGTSVGSITCTTSSLSGTLRASGSTSGTGVATVTPAFGGCTVVGQGAKMACANASFNAISYAAPTVSGSTTGISCNIVLNSGACGNTTNIIGGIVLAATIVTAVTVIVGGAKRFWNWVTAGQNDNVSWPSAACGLGSGPASGQGTLTDTSGTALHEEPTTAFYPEITG